MEGRIQRLLKDKYGGAENLVQYVGNGDRWTPVRAKGVFRVANLERPNECAGLLHFHCEGTPCRAPNDSEEVAAWRIGRRRGLRHGHKNSENR